MLQTRLRRCAPLCLTVLLAGPGAAVAHAHSRTPARLARVRAGLTSVDEHGSLKMQGSKGTTIAEQGICWGTFPCSVAMQMTLSGTLVTAGFTAYLRGGAISGTARARIRSATTAAAYFSGTISLRGGTRARSHASGVARFQGTIDRKSYALAIHISGRLRL
jgi:hypothetical protein